jgi:two-component system, NarL family, sensor kinase
MKNVFGMKRSIAVTCCMILSVCLILGKSVDAQTTTGISDIVGKLLEQDFKKLEVKAQDSVLVNQQMQIFEKDAETRNDSAISLAVKAIRTACEAGLVKKLSFILQELGEYYISKENFSEATNCFIYSLRIEEKRNDQKRMADLYDQLGVVYLYQEIFPKSLEYHQKALAIYQNLKDTSKIATVFSHLGALYTSHEYCEKRTIEQNMEDYGVALNYFQKSLVLFEKIHYREGLASVWSNIGNVYRRTGDLENALLFTQKSLKYYRENRKNGEIAETLRILGLIYNRLQKYDLALACMLESKEIGLREKMTDGIQFLYEDIGQTYYYLKDYKNSRDYYVKYMTIRDSVYNNEKSKQIFELETKYQTEKKQGEIERLTLVKKHRTLVIYILIASLLLVLVLGWMQFRNIRHKKIIADQKLEIKEKQLLELEKERQLTAAKSVLQGEEAERSRLAGDLHDGLGGMLTGVKLKLSFMKENAIITSENLAHFNHALDLLDTSITEMRRVAHNLMPETLMHYGLRTALTDFIKQVAPEGLPVIRLNTFGEDLRYEKEIEITLYRITQELTTNALKHAQAKQIDIQLFTEQKRICVQVIDNGIGFDPENLDPSKTGAGLKNIHDRVTAFNGKFEILSYPEKGTESLIEFLIS